MVDKINIADLVVITGLVTGLIMAILFSLMNWLCLLPPAFLDISEDRNFHRTKKGVMTNERSNLRRN